jgi:mono/diheme cytochrome c family protein
MTAQCSAMRAGGATLPLMIPSSPWRVLVALCCVAGCERQEPAIDPAALAAMPVPPQNERGAQLFTTRCAACHGPLALGTTVGPPLLHVVYRPAHHGDEAFQLAVAQGVRAHHWRFGDMAPVPDLTRADVAAIITHVRWLQRAAGIE